MNIETKLQQIRKARKRRSILLFHPRLIGGVDVLKEQYSEVQIFLRLLFKQLKVLKFGIEISHWGEIYLIEPERDIQILLSINLQVVADDVDGIKKALKSHEYIVSDEIPATEQLSVSFRANRYGTKWHFPPLKLEVSCFGDVVKQLIKSMQSKVSKLSSEASHQPNKQPHEITFDDIIALINYGAAKLGPDSQLAHIANNRELHFSKRCSLNNGQLTFTSYDLKQHQYHLLPHSIKIFKILLPDVIDMEKDFLS